MRNHLEWSGGIALEDSPVAKCSVAEPSETRNSTREQLVLTDFLALAICFRYWLLATRSTIELNHD